jgi:hypothetical protein
LHRAGTVLDHDGPAELGGEMLAEDARHQIAVRARRQRHDNADRAGGVGLRGGRLGANRQQHDRKHNAPNCTTGVLDLRRHFSPRLLPLPYHGRAA